MPSERRLGKSLDSSAPAPPITMKSAETGRQISALNPEAYQWVIATGYIVNAQAGRLLIGREFTEAEKEELLRDNRRLARLLHVPMRGYPESQQEMADYFEAIDCGATRSTRPHASELGAQSRDQVDGDRQDDRAEQVGQQRLAQHRRPDGGQSDLGV